MIQNIFTEMEVITREIIKPSSPTPSYLQIYPLSFIDHLCPPNYIPLLFFYQNQSFEPDNNGETSITIFEVFEERTKILKKSLSEVLSLYYPFAGRLKDQVSMECDDEGVIFIATHMKQKLSEILKDPEEEFLNPLFPDEMHWKKLAGPLVAVQVNHFECGGTAISVCLSHKVAEASSLCHFVKDWASITTKKSQVTFPHFNGASVFPIHDLPIYPEKTDEKSKAKNMVSKRFVFDATNIKSLIAIATNQGVENPTREQVVGALIYKCVVSSLRSNSKDSNQLITYLNVALDLRAGLVPPQPEKSIGNLVWGFAVPSSNSRDEEEGLHELVRKIQKGLCEFWETYSKGFEKEEMMKILEVLKATNNENSSNNVVVFNVTSWCGIGMYEADFGWGKPVWVTTCGCPPKKDVALLMDSRDGEGIEVLVAMEEQNMALLEANVELVQYASINPSVVD